MGYFNIESIWKNQSSSWTILGNLQFPYTLDSLYWNNTTLNILIERIL
jgi:hypothetical protein